MRLTVDHCKHSVYSEEQTWHYESMSFDGRTTPQVITTYLYPVVTSEPSDPEVRVNLTYQQLKPDQMERQGGQGGKLRTAATSFKIPFSFFAQMQPEVVKDNDNFKLVLQLTGPCPSLLELFRDVQRTEEVEMTNPKQMTFVLRNQETVSVLISKDDLKVRL